MKVGLVGLGKLGMPVALALAHKGHDVMGYDVDDARMQKEVFPHREIGPDGEPSIEPLLRESTIRFGSLDEVVAHAEIVFVAVQTPHEPRVRGRHAPPGRARGLRLHAGFAAPSAALAQAIERLGRGQDRDRHLDRAARDDPPRDPAAAQRPREALLQPVLHRDGDDDPRLPRSRVRAPREARRRGRRSVRASSTRPSTTGRCTRPRSRTPS